MPQRKVEIATAIKRSALFRALPASALARLAANATALNLPCGEHLYRAGERCPGPYSVVSGRIMLSVGDPAGATKVVELAGPGNHIGLAKAMLGELEITTAEAIADSRVLLIPRETILACAHEHQAFGMQLVMALSREVCARVADIEGFTLRSGRERIADYLLQTVAANGRVRAVTLPAKKSIIASRLNLTPEYFSRTLRDLIEAGAIAVSGRQITVLDPTRLRASYR